MSGLETAIRNALQRSDRANPEIRARIYQSARQALEAGLRKQDITDTDIISGQRQRLEATIRSIEGEERMRLQASVVPPDAGALRPPTRPAAPPQPQPQPQPQPREVQPPSRSEPVVEAGPAVQGETRREPAFAEHETSDADLDDVRAGPGDHLGVEAPEGEPDAMPAAARSMNFKPERAVVRRKPRKFFSRLLVFCIVVAALGMGAWWVKTSGVLMTAAQRDTSVRNPPAHVEAEDYDGNDDSDSSPGTGNSGLATIDPQDTFSNEWIEIFKPTDAQKVAAGGQSKAENVSENEGPAVRITSSASGADGDAVIEVPANVVQQMAGKASTIALTLQATSDTPSQITVECDFQSLGGCGRHRFDVTRLKSDALFQVRLSQASASASAGKLIINSNVDGKGSGVNVYAIRVLPGE
ncbi:hypothetical protein DTW90_08370 [Neorhizobium sp. P12A]|uniref:hypothetical protein n=1 Tax=Neorhizobium sp. P12A TaxID=2268027 RepID=UPI0011EC0255|nr:hypothetical protein [Neorhizobium sp. P12A]KAA0699401.1 hypothetical protein DTW90_08370 [Neorhizobium sp. P12A]